jgi:hypothetical protein
MRLVSAQRPRVPAQVAQGVAVARVAWAADAGIDLVAEEHGGGLWVRWPSPQPEPTRGAGQVEHSDRVRTSSVEIPDDEQRVVEVAAMLRKVGALPDEEG